MFYVLRSRKFSIKNSQKILFCKVRTSESMQLSESQITIKYFQQWPRAIDEKSMNCDCVSRSICKRERPSVEEDCLPTSKYQFYKHLHIHFVSNRSCALLINCQRWALNMRPSPLRSRFPFKNRVWQSRSRNPDSTNRQQKILCASVLFFLLQNLCYNFQALMPFKLLAVIWPGGQSAGRQESGGGGWEAPWHQSPLPACSARHRHGRGVNTLHRPVGRS